MQLHHRTELHEESQMICQGDHYDGVVWLAPATVSRKGLSTNLLCCCGRASGLWWDLILAVILVMKFIFFFPKRMFRSKRHLILADGSQRTGSTWKLSGCIVGETWEDVKRSLWDILNHFWMALLKMQVWRWTLSGNCIKIAWTSILPPVELFNCVSLPLA